MRSLSIVKKLWLKAATFMRWKAQRKFLFIEAFLYLGIARVWLQCTSFQRVARCIGTPQSAEQPQLQTPVLLDPPQHQAVREIGWAVLRASRNAPFRAVCLQQAVAAKMMLSRRNIRSVMRFGVSKANNRLQAHAWLDCGDIKVTGYPLAYNYTEIVRFH